MLYYYIELSNLAPNSALKLFDALGKSLSMSFISSSKIDTSGLSNGIYFLSTQSQLGTQLLKFIKN